MKLFNRMEVLVLTAHLIITLAMIGAYTFFTYLDKGTTTIENMLLIAVGFWFSAMGKNTPTNTTNVQHANEVKTIAPEKEERGI